jgi:hypothetical protein
MLRRMILTAAVAAVAAHATDARACGCFAQSSTAAPVVQAGERILFAHEGDQVIAYIQIQYQGAADQFGWLVPLPSVPTLQIGTDELFRTLDKSTLPQYVLTRTRQLCSGGTTTAPSSSGGFGCAAFGSGADDSPAYGGSDMNVASVHDLGAAPDPIVVEQASIGPYDYAVLKADDESAMLQWLTDNRYFVPAGTMDAAKPYIHPGGFFLALKLSGGQTAGDVTPIVLRYTSDLPMIPITLTQVGAVENMGILVWVLGEARAIPRNYYHVVVDDLPLFFSNFANDNLQLINAVHEAPGKHGFITQYAGPSGLVSLGGASRFGNLDTLRAKTNPADYLHYLRDHNYSFDATLLSILSRYIPEPPALVDLHVSLLQFYTNFDNYISYLPGTDPDGGVAMPFDPAACTSEIDTRIVTPTRDVQALFSRHRYLTRLYTAMSPKDMTIDPVFSSNPDLADVPLRHSATLTTPCIGDPWLATDLGFEAQYRNGFPPNLNLPAALRVELLRDAGAPELVQDNTETIRTTLGVVDHGQATSPSSGGGGGLQQSSGCGCTVGRMRVHTNVAMLFGLCALALGVRSLRRRRG